MDEGNKKYLKPSELWEARRSDRGTVGTVVRSLCRDWADLWLNHEGGWANISAQGFDMGPLSDEQYEEKEAEGAGLEAEFAKHAAARLLEKDIVVVSEREGVEEALFPGHYQAYLYGKRDDIADRFPIRTQRAALD